MASRRFGKLVFHFSLAVWYPFLFASQDMLQEQMPIPVPLRLSDMCFCSDFYLQLETLTPPCASEVQLLIDGQLAGVSWPFPIIFTGGIVPGFWRPIVGIDAFDLRQHEIDVTPWLPLLCDGASHTFEIRVAGLNDDGAGHATLSEVVGSYWVVTGTIFLFLGQDGSVTTGTSTSIDTPLPKIEISSSITTNSTGANETLEYSTAVSRDIIVTSTVKSSNGTRNASWTQSLSYNNFNSVRIISEPSLPVRQQIGVTRHHLRAESIFTLQNCLTT